jgi:diphthamide synthase (EF-2-diphthine--ammonia ligase)
MKTLLAWSSGKDSAWTLACAAAPECRVGALLTTINEAADRVAMHGVRRIAAGSAGGGRGCPLWPVPLPWPCTNEDYESRMAEACRRAVAEGFDSIAFGDLYLRDVREYRERQLAGSGLTPLFPLWELPTASLAREMIAAGSARAHHVRRFEGSRRRIRRAGSSTTPAGGPAGAVVDPCGENGEFHTLSTTARCSARRSK